MSDSDSEDSLLAAPTFTAKRKRVEEKRVQSGFDIIDDALDHMNQLTQQDDRIEKIRLQTQSDEDEELVARVEEEIANVASQSASQRRDQVLMGVKEDDDDVLGSDRRMALTIACDTSQSSALGVRRTLVFHPGKHFDADPNEATHVKQLTDCLNALEKTNRSNKKLKDALINPLLKVIKYSLLSEFLSCKRLAELRDEHKLKTVPQEFIMWLYRASCSGGGSLISLGAYESLTALWIQDSEDFVDHQSMMTLPDMYSHLQSWVSEEDPNDHTKQCNQDATGNHQNYLGFATFLRLWTTAFRTGQVLFTSTKTDEMINSTLEVATNLIVSLVRAGLDVSFHLANQGTCGLTVALQDVLCELIHYVANDVCINDEQLLNWMKVASEKTVTTLKKLGPGAPDTDDSYDDQAWLCLFLAASMFPTKDCKLAYSKNAAQFKAILSMQALKICIGVESWESEVSSILSKTNCSDLVDKAEVSTAWLAILSSFASLEEINLKGDTIATDGPRCLAIVEISSSSLDAGLDLLTPSSKIDCEYGTRDDANAHSRILKLLADQSSRLAIRMNKSSTNALFRRIAYRLNCSHKYYGSAMERAKSYAGTRERQVVQTDLHSWYKQEPRNTNRVSLST